MKTSSQTIKVANIIQKLETKRGELISEFEELDASDPEGNDLWYKARGIEIAIEIIKEEADKL